MRFSSRTVLAAIALAAPALAAAGHLPGGTPPAEAAAANPPVGHVFVVNLENKGYDQTFGPGSPAPYLSSELRSQGQLLTHYYGTAHNSLPNYLAQISGQGPNPQTQGDCQTYSDFVQTATVAPGQAVGQGCVYPTSVTTVADQLTTAGLTWRGYMEDMGTPCRHPAANAADDTQKAEVGDQYAARHNPFVYFKSITSSPSCAQNDVDLAQLPGDLASTATTANLTYITPNLCNDGHDSPCVDGRPGGLATADQWLRTWIPRILASPAYQQDGLLVVTFDEADTGSPSGADACCGEGPGPNSPMPGIYGMGGGRTGAVLVSPFITPGSTNDTAYNHYGLLRTIEDTFGLAPLGYAQNATGFGSDVYAG
ncbi:phospholipase C [Nocardioides ginsengisegetis]|uniref:phospholipase C n=1 Tax=Nocardioides ginsengisegetis TaxID=661491 RepID=A0A7W3J3B8_9ACTN|nr:alkaline phosphatase family protein [Nocardioides ginsengisegetis]MBA8805359.1 phospholipase C [Nocardioides ginsengisegetis]